MKRIRKKRVVFFVSVEGKSEQAFIKCLEIYAREGDLFITIDCVVLKGGGYESMLNDAVLQRKRREAKKYKPDHSILLVDADRAILGDDHWSLEELREEALKQKMNVFIQNPNLEGVLLRMLPGRENARPCARDANKLLRKLWKDYEKPADAQMLRSKFTVDDLLRVAKVDNELKRLLLMIGLISD